MLTVCPGNKSVKLHKLYSEYMYINAVDWKKYLGIISSFYMVTGLCKCICCAGIEVISQESIITKKYLHSCEITPKIGVGDGAVRQP